MEEIIATRFLHSSPAVAMTTYRAIVPFVMGYWQYIELDWELVDIYDVGRYLRSYEATPEPARDLIAAHWLYSEVSNGGFHQFFHNPTGVLAPESVQGFQIIGLTDVAEMTAEAMSFFVSPYPRDRDVRIAALDRYARRAAAEADREAWDPFYRLDNRFYVSLQGHRFEHAADAYVSKFEEAGL